MKYLIIVLLITAIEYGEWLDTSTAESCSALGYEGSRVSWLGTPYCTMMGIDISLEVVLLNQGVLD